jgi:hypothetical protein
MQYMKYGFDEMALRYSNVPEYTISSKADILEINDDGIVSEYSSFAIHASDPACEIVRHYSAKAKNKFIFWYGNTFYKLGGNVSD